MPWKAFRNPDECCHAALCCYSTALCCYNVALYCYNAALCCCNTALCCCNTALCCCNEAVCCHDAALCCYSAVLCCYNAPMCYCSAALCCYTTTKMIFFSIRRVARLLQPALLEFSVAVYVQTVCQLQKAAQISMGGGFVAGCKSRPVVKGVFWL